MPKKFDLKKSALIAGTVTLFALVAASLWLDAGSDRYQGHRMHHRYSMYAATPAAVEDWMTFDYLNEVFQLPPIYLENTLNIDDPQYPNISLRNYAESHDLDLGIFLTSVESAIKAHTATSTSGTP